MQDDLKVSSYSVLARFGKIQERYGVAKEAAQKQADEFMKMLHEEDTASVLAGNKRST